MKAFLLRMLALLSALLLLTVSACADGCDHSFDSGEVTTAPTCDTIGIITYTCTLCGEQMTAKLGNLGHSYDDSGVCVRCHRNESGEYTEPQAAAVSMESEEAAEAAPVIVTASVTVPVAAEASAEAPVSPVSVQAEQHTGSDGSARLLLLCLAGSFLFVFTASGLLGTLKKRRRAAAH